MIITLYVHCSKEDAIKAGEKAGLRGAALEMFKFAGMEHLIEYDVNEETGRARPILIDRRPIGDR